MRMIASDRFWSADPERSELSGSATTEVEVGMPPNEVHFYCEPPAAPERLKRGPIVRAL